MFLPQKGPFLPAKIDEDHFSGSNRPKPVFPVKNQFFRPELTKTTFPGQIQPKRVFPAKIDPNHIFRADNRKMKIAELRPKREKQTPFSSVLIPRPGRGRGRGVRGLRVECSEADPEPTCGHQPDPTQPDQTLRRTDITRSQLGLPPLLVRGRGRGRGRLTSVIG